MVASSSANVKVGPQVFINFRGAELRKTFITHLSDALKRDGINAFIDNDLLAGENLEALIKKIEESTVALAILSSRYTESRWCLKELEKIMERVERDDLWVIPIFYKLKPGTVKDLSGKFGVDLWDLWRKEGRDDKILKWDAALQGVASKLALEMESESCEENAFLNKIIHHVKNALTKQLLLREANSKRQRRGGENPKPEDGSSQMPNITISGEKRLKQLEEKFDVDNETRVVGIVGMPGVGKTYLAKKIFVELSKKITRHVSIKFDREKSKEQGLDWLQKTLVEGLLKKEYPDLICDDGNALEVCKDLLIEKKVVIVFDNVIHRKQINVLLENCDWIKKGSRILITTRDKSLLKELACELYEVPELNEREGLELFRDQFSTTLEGNFMEMSRKFVDYAGGNPLALEEFGEELREKDEDYWKARLGTLTQRSNQKIGKKLRICFDELNEQHKDAFLEIAYFFRSHDENYVRSLLDSFNHETSEAGTEVIRYLADKFLIRVSNAKVEMQDLLLTLSKELSETSGGKYWLFPSTFAESTDVLTHKEGRDKVRGIVLDLSKMEEKPLDNQAFVGMSNLRYLKVYNSTDPYHSEAECKLNLPDGLEFAGDNIVRYIYWMKFSGEELPSNFSNIIDLRLPYSKITRVWHDTKLAPNLKWVDLSFSSKLSSLSGLSNARNLLRLNLEGCISLEEVPEEMKEMKSLVFLNLRKCTSLSSLPDINMGSLKVLILSGCSKLQKFQVISDKLETLYLNGTAINELPSIIGNLEGLILLNMKDCKNLVTLPNCLGKLTSLQELKLSRCSKLNSFPDVKENMVNLRILLLDGTSITEMPITINSPSLSLLQRLCLSRNDEIRNLKITTSHLRWLELKYCKNLTSLQLPPNLQSLDAHGCTSLKTVTSSIALPRPTDNIHSSLIFTNCNKLEQASKNVIISYLEKKGQLMTDDHYNRDFVFSSLIGTCFPGCEVPVWFNHQAFESRLKMNMPRDWNEGRLNGVALCAVVSFKEFKDHTNTLQVKCTCDFTDHASINLKRVTFIIGGWSEPGDHEARKIESDHVFIGYTSWFNTKKDENEYVPTEVSLRFEVTNGTSEVKECKVMKCGFSLVYESDEAENVSWEASSNVTSGTEDSKHSETESNRASEQDVDYSTESSGLLNEE